MYQLFIILIPLITIPYISRVLGPSGVGINSYTTSIAQYFILLATVGINIYGNREIAYVRDNSNTLNKTFWEIFTLKILTTVFSVVVFLVVTILSSTYSTYLLAQSVSVIAVAFDISWFFMGIENFRVTVLRNFFVKILTLVLIFMFVRTKNDTAMYILINSLSTLIGNITLFPYLKKYVSFKRISNFQVFRHMKPSLALFIPQIAIQIYVVLNKYMLGKLDSVTASGFYDNSDKVVRMILAIVTAVGTVMLPHIANEFSSGNKSKVVKTFKTSFSFVTFITVPLVFGLLVVAKAFAVMFFGRGFAQVGSVMQIEAIAALFISWDTAIGNQYLLPTKKNRQYTISVSIGALVNIILNIPMIMLYGVIGAMIVTVISEVCVTITMLWYIRNEMSIVSLYHESWKFFCAGITFFIVLNLLNNFVILNWITLFVEIVIAALIYIGVLLILQPDFFTGLKEFANN